MKPPVGLLFAVLFGVFCVGGTCTAFEIPLETTQLVVGRSHGWDDTHVTLQRWTRSASGWEPVGAAWPGRLGRNGLAWGLGLHPQPPGAVLKKEGDGRAPAGVFALGGVYGYGPASGVQRAAGLAYHQVGPSDLWVEDPDSPDYNRHIRLPGRGPATEWEKAQQMKQGDPAHSLKLLIHHNTGPRIVPGGGSAIFFHIWRQDGAKTSAGCTVMSEADLRTLIAWVDPKKRPLFVLLPEQDYLTLRPRWKLP